MSSSRLFSTASLSASSFSFLRVSKAVLRSALPFFSSCESAFRPSWFVGEDRDNCHCCGGCIVQAEGRARLHPQGRENHRDQLFGQAWELILRVAGPVGGEDASVNRILDVREFKHPFRRG